MNDIRTLDRWSYWRSLLVIGLLRYARGPSTTAATTSASHRTSRRLARRQPV